VVALKRPAALSDDTAPAIDYVRHALAALEPTHGVFDAIVIVQPSSPLTLASDIDATVALLASSGADSAVSVMQLDHAIHPVKLKSLVGDRLLPYLEDEGGRMAAHELPTLYVRNCAVYASRRGVIESGAIIGADCRGYVMPRERSVDINDEIDFAFCEFLFARMHSHAVDEDAR
jgi:CMP-N-acetylneuraminic acid synthetase